MNTTESPIKNISIKEKIAIARKEHGKEVANKIAADELNKKIFKQLSILTEDDILNKTSHLPNFDLVRNVASLQGSEYIMMIKDLYKMLISFAVPEHLRIIKVGEVKTDMRHHCNNVLSSGKGKKNISMAVKKILKTFNPDANIKEPRTIHYQHLIGKMLLRKEEVEDGVKKDGTPKYKKIENWIPKFGFLNADLLILEEAYEIFNSQEKNDVDCRDAITVALDCYGENLIQKQNMDNLDTKEETLEYYPYVNILSFLQPLKMSETFVTKGLSRRLSTNYKEFPEKTGLDKYVNRLSSNVDDTESCAEFSNFMKKIRCVKTNWKLLPDAFDSFVLCHAALLEQGFRQDRKIAHYTRILEYPMQNILLKMSALQALTNFRTEITKRDVELAFVDIIERLVYEFQYIDKKIKGKLDYGEGWGGATGKVQQCLEELYEIGAESKETSIPIWQFQKMISKVFDISERRAFDKYKEMKEGDELIEDYRGQGKDNGVWLNFEPKMDSVRDNENDKIDPKKLYFMFSDMTEKSDMTHKTPMHVLNKSEISISIDNTNDKTDKNITPKGVKPTPKKPSKSKNVNNALLGVISDISDISQDKTARDTHYSEAEECKSIVPCDKYEVFSHIKEHPKATLPELLEKFGPGVMKLKQEGLI